MECPAVRSTVEEDRTDRARGSRGSFRLSNLVEARMAEQHSSSSVVPSNVAAVHAAAPAPAADATLVRLTIQTTSVPEANTRPSTQRQIQIQLNPDQRLLPLLHGLSMEPIWDKWCPSLSNCGTKGCHHPPRQSNMSPGSTDDSPLDDYLRYNNRLRIF